MKAVAGSWPFGRGAGLRAVLVFITAASVPALAQENGPDVTTMPVGTVFRWLNFLLVFGVFAYLIAKFGGPYFRGRARGIGKAIDEARHARAVAEREFREAEQKLGSIDAGIQQEWRVVEQESASDRERIRALTDSEIEKIGQAARAEIAAAERAGTQELRAIAAKLATERAAALIRQRLNASEEAALFDAFVEELAKTTA
jgi:F0F1-type ATP synthase membrane subunit b/b'